MSESLLPTVGPTENFLVNSLPVSNEHHLAAMSAADEPRFTCSNKPVATAKVLPPTLLPAALTTRQRMLKVKCEHAAEACS